MNKDLETHCPKCGTFCSRPILSPSTTVERIDKTDTQIIMTGLMKKQNGMEIVRVPRPAWGYICDNCHVFFAVLQELHSGTITNDEMKSVLKQEEVK